MYDVRCFRVLLCGRPQVLVGRRCGELIDSKEDGEKMRMIC